MDDIWKPIDGFEDYAISSSGKVRSIRPRKGSRATINGGIISGWVQSINHGKYKRRLVALRKDGRTYTRKVHQLVLENFVRPRKNGEESLHINGDSLDNRLENLRWGAHSENIADSIAKGTHVKPPIHWGENHPMATISSSDVTMIKNHVFVRGDQVRFARMFGVNVITIARISRGLSRTKG